MRLILLTSASFLLLAACNADKAVDITPPTADKPVFEAAEAPQADAYNAKAQFKKYAAIKMDDVDTSFLSPSEVAVVNKLIQASKLMTQIYRIQMTADYGKVRKTIAESGQVDAKDLTRLFNLYFKRCDELAQNQPFFGDTPCPAGNGFYPEDITREEFNQWIADHPKQADAFKSGYTIIRRKDDKLIAVPYSRAFKGPLTKASTLLREAADLSEEPTLKRFLTLRADAFLSDDYYESELAWMDLEGNIEVAIGPYETYDDGLFGYKTAYESFVTIKNPEESAALAKYKNYLRDMEENLPVAESYKNFQRGFASPIAVTYQIQGGGDNVNGVQTIAFNLPNDERVREAKGAKKVILNNVLGAKYDRILAPIAANLLVKEQAAITDKKFMSYATLFHELSHSLGPGTITKNGVKTTVTAELKELYSGLEEGKADVMGAYNVLYMIERGEIPASERDAFLATYFSGLFRSMRFGLAAAHAKGAAIQYSYYREVGAVTWDEELNRFRVDYDKLAQAISDLTAKFVIVQGDGDYDQAQAFLVDYAKVDDLAISILEGFDKIPVDIRPIYPKEL
ncbi:MAG: hypothetical protein ABJ275_01710 [Maricaulaceae bacterium]